VTIESIRKKLVRWLMPANDEIRKMPNSDVPPAASGSATVAAVDEKKLSELTQIMGANMHELIDAFLEDMPARLGEMKAALSDHRFEEVSKIAHTLKGSSGNIGAFTLAGLLVNIETRCRTVAADEAYRVLTVIEQEAMRVCAELTRFKSLRIQASAQA